MLTDTLATIFNTRKIANAERCRVKKRADVLRKGCDGGVEVTVVFRIVIHLVVATLKHDYVDTGICKSNPIILKQTAEAKEAFIG